MPKKTIQAVTAKQTLNRVRAERMPFEWSINPYRGCAHGCSFCYARAFQSFIGMGAEDEFQNHIFVKENAAEALEDQLSRMARKLRGGPEAVGPRIGTVAIGTATDPYQPVEATARITRSCLEVLAKYHVPTAITTRSPLILRDIDLLQRMHITSVNISVNTMNAEITRSLEPATPFPLKRMETVAALVREGIPAGVFAAPILPYLTDSEEELSNLFQAAKEHNALFVMTSLLRLTRDVKPWYFHIVEQSYPYLIPMYAKLYQQSNVERGYAEMKKAQIAALMHKFQLSGDIPVAAARPAATPFEKEVEQLVFAF